MVNQHKSGKYIVSSSSGLTVRNEFYKMNAVLVLSEKDFLSNEILGYITDGYLRYMGPESHTAKAETLDPAPISEVKLTPKKPDEKNSKEIKGVQNDRS